MSLESQRLLDCADVGIEQCASHQRKNHESAQIDRRPDKPTQRASCSGSALSPSYNELRQCHQQSCTQDESEEVKCNISECDVELANTDHVRGPLNLPGIIHVLLQPDNSRLERPTVNAKRGKCIVLVSRYGVEQNQNGDKCSYQRQAKPMKAKSPNVTLQFACPNIAAIHGEAPSQNRSSVPEVEAALCCFYRQTERSDTTNNVLRTP